MQLHCFSFQFFIMLLVFLLFQGKWSSVECFRLDPRGAKYVRELVNEFLADPTSSRFDQIILPPQIGEELSDFLHPKVYIWCPITHWKIEVKCPLHGCQLTPRTFTDVVDKTSPKNPRLVYDLRGNVLMVQRIYLCRHKEKPHRYLSGSETILRSIPSLYSHACFPILMLYRSACSKNLVDHLETQILQGVSFLKTCEGLAAINFKEFSHRLRRYTLSAKSNVTDTGKLYEKFYADPMFSFPSNDLLMHIFLADF